MAKGMHKPKSLKKRQDLFDTNGSINKSDAYKRPGSLKK